MFVTETIEFNPESLNSSIKNFKLIKRHIDNYYRTIEYFIIIKHLLKYLKTHPETELCNSLSIQDMIKNIKYIGLQEFRDNIGDQNQNYLDFMLLKIQEFGFQKNTHEIRGTTMFKTWFIIDRAIEKLEIEENRGR